MNGSNPVLRKLLSRLQKSAGLAPPTPDQADVLMVGPEEVAIDDAKLLDIANTVVHGGPSSRSMSSSTLWIDGDASTKAEYEHFALNRNKGDVDEETLKQIEEAEKKALNDDDQDDDENGMEGKANPA